MLFVCHRKILHKHCFQFLLGPFSLPRETEDNAYAKFWYVMSILVCFEHFGMLWYFLEWSIAREQGWGSSESTHLPPMWPGLKSWHLRHMWVEFVVGSLPYSERFFSGYSGFPLYFENQHFQIPIRSGALGHVSSSS